MGTDLDTVQLMETAASWHLEELDIFRCHVQEAFSAADKAMAGIDADIANAMLALDTEVSHLMDSAAAAHMDLASIVVQIERHVLPALPHLEAELKIGRHQSVLGLVKLATGWLDGELGQDLRSEHARLVYRAGYHIPCAEMVLTYFEQPRREFADSVELAREALRKVRSVRDALESSPDSMDILCTMQAQLQEIIEHAQDLRHMLVRERTIVEKLPVLLVKYASFSAKLKALCSVYGDSVRKAEAACRTVIPWGTAACP